MPFNPMEDGTARTIKAQYHKTGLPNFSRVGNFGATGALEIYEEQDTNETDMAKKYRIRKFTPTECFALMGVQEEEIKVLKNSGISDTQLYKMAGNSIVVDVLMGIFKQMFNAQPEAQNENERQITFPWW